MDVKERLTLEEATAPTLIASEHRHRYRFAAGLLGGRRVVDLCCGSGYGAVILAEGGAERVHGVDSDAATVDAARAAVGSDRLTFEAADAVAYLRAADAAELDAIVCFEGLEHLDDPEAAFAQLRRLAEAGVAMLLSVPNSEGLGEHNEFHRTDFSWERGRADLGSLPGAVLLCQYLAEGSLIAPADDAAGHADGATVALDDAEPEYANHYLACVGVDPAGVDGAMRLESAPLHNRYVADLERANVELRRANTRLLRERLGRSDAAGGAVARRLEDGRADRERLRDLEEEFNRWTERCLGAEAREEALKARVARLDAERGSWPMRIARVLLAVRRGRR